MNSAKAETTHNEHETANYRAQNSDQQPGNRTRHTRKNKNLPPYYTKRTLDAVTYVPLGTPRRPGTENETQQQQNTNSHTTRRTRTGISRGWGYMTGDGGGGWDGCGVCGWVGG